MLALSNTLQTVGAVLVCTPDGKMVELSFSARVVNATVSFLIGDIRTAKGKLWLRFVLLVGTPKGLSNLLANAPSGGICASREQYFLTVARLCVHAAAQHMFL